MKDNVFIDVSDGSCAKKLQVLISKTKYTKGLTYGVLQLKLLALL